MDLSTCRWAPRKAWGAEGAPGAAPPYAWPSSPRAPKGEGAGGGAGQGEERRRGRGREGAPGRAKIGAEGAPGAAGNL